MFPQSTSPVSPWTKSKLGSTHLPTDKLLCSSFVHPAAGVDPVCGGGGGILHKLLNWSDFCATVSIKGRVLKLGPAWCAVMVETGPVLIMECT